VILHAVFVKAVMEINSVYFGPMCCLHHTVLFEIISASHLNKQKKKGKGLKKYNKECSFLLHL